MDEQSIEHVDVLVVGGGPVGSYPAPHTRIAMVVLTK